MDAARASALDEIVALLEQSAAHGLPGIDDTHDLLDHALQTAAVLAAEHPDDVELAVAGLVHDVGHLLTPDDDDRHGDAGADFVAPVLGPRVAGMVRLHVPAKRYLVATDPEYFGRLAPDSVASLALQGGAMTPGEVAAFEALAHAADAVVLRRADDRGKVVGLDVAPLESWISLLSQVSERVAAGTGA